MKIGTKLVISLAAPLVVLTLILGSLSLRNSQAHLREELEREGRAAARATQLAMEHYLRDRRLEDIRRVAEHLSNYERILGVRIFDREGALIYQSLSLASYSPTKTSSLPGVLQGRKATETRLQWAGQPLVNFAFPLKDPAGELYGVLEVLQSLSFLDEEAQAVRRSVVTLTVAMMLSMGVVVLMVTRFSVGRPVEELVRRFRGVGPGEIPAPIPVRRRDEIGRLAEEFNRMCARLAQYQEALVAEQAKRRRVEDRLWNAERLASLGRLSTGLAHEIGTPLNVIRGRAESLIRKLPGDDVWTRNLRTIVGQIDRIARIVRGMLDFARAPEPHLTQTDVSPILRKIVEFLGERFEEAGIHVETSLPADLPGSRADPDLLHQVFLNLITNALDAMPRGGLLSIRAERVEAHSPDQNGSERPFLAIAFEDTGIGIDRENLKRIFDPFFTTKDVGKGTGLGLSISYGIVRKHGGWIDAASEPGRGTSLTVYLPVETAAAEPRAAVVGAAS